MSNALVNLDVPVYFYSMETESDLHLMEMIFTKDQPSIGAFDTETTGLHHIYDKPFLVQVGYITPYDNSIKVWIIEVNTLIGKRAIALWHDELAPMLTEYAGHNVKFDLHMLQNIGTTYRKKNITDTLFYIRFAHDAVPISSGGVPLGLKEYTSRYICKNAKEFDKKVQRERSNLAKVYNIKLRKRLGLTQKAINEFTKDKTFKPEDLPLALRKAFHAWVQEDLPERLQTKALHSMQITKDMIAYDMISKEIVKEYAGYDVVFTLLILNKLKPVIRYRKNEEALTYENALIYPLVEMERVGFNADAKYLYSSIDKMRTYIRERREDLPKGITVGQHAAIKAYIKEVFGITLDSTSDEALEDAAHTAPEDLKHLIETIRELRTLEKWYSVYLLRFEEQLSKGDRLYTTISQVGAVSGRVSSDFQQFPRNAIFTKDGEELFHPRRLIKTDSAIVYLDYSQIELRFQAFYTQLVGDPDKNMCRAYMPWLCHKADGTKFNPQNPKHIKEAYSGEWLHDEDNTPWEPVDVHGATATAATGLKPGDKGYKDARYEGKRLNFSKNYGATITCTRKLFPNKTEEELRRIDGAYYKAFPGVKSYHNYCEQLAISEAYAVNLFGVKYYNASGHKLKNMLIQGSAAYYLKLKILELYEFSKKHNLKSKWQMQIHDELSWEYDPADPPEIFFEFKRIMENWEDGWIPIVADMEATITTWAEKKDINTIDELKELLK